MILKAIKKAFEDLTVKGYNKIYWVIDLHGTCIKSNYVSHQYELLNDQVIPTLQLIQSLPESVLILWTSCYQFDKVKVLMFFNDNGVTFNYVNCNPEIENTKTGNFDKKFFCSVGIDDKFGFDPNTEWEIIYNYLTFKKNIREFKTTNDINKMTIIEILKERFLDKQIKIEMPVYDRGKFSCYQTKHGKVKDIYSESDMYHTDYVVVTFYDGTDCYLEPDYNLEIC